LTGDPGAIDSPAGALAAPLAEALGAAGTNEVDGTSDSPIAAKTAVVKIHTAAAMIAAGNPILVGKFLSIPIIALLI
jgi:hypothetical protein